MDDLISRVDAIEAVEHITSSMSVCINTDECHGMKRMQRQAVIELTNMPSAQPERLTDDDFETIRIHLSAYKEKLCNQYRWKEAEEYQRIIDRFMGFASGQPEVIRCKDCEDYQTDWETSGGLHYGAIIDTDMPPEGFCSKATRKGEQPCD